MDKIDRFIVFGGDYYYPKGGSGDVKATLRSLQYSKVREFVDSCDWWEVLDCETGNWYGPEDLKFDSKNLE